jgi:hypothetical protein
MATSKASKKRNAANKKAADETLERAGKVCAAFEACLEKNFSEVEMHWAKTYVVHRLAAQMNLSDDAPDNILAELGTHKRWLGQ